MASPSGAEQEKLITSAKPQAESALGLKLLLLLMGMLSVQISRHWKPTPNGGGKKAFDFIPLLTSVLLPTLALST